MKINDGRVVSNFIMQALRGKDITIYGDGKQTRSFQYIDDLIFAMISMMDTEDNFIGPVNVGNPTEITIKELCKMILDLTNSNSKLVYNKLPVDDPKRRKPDISRAKKNLNWDITTDLKSGLLKTINYFNEIQINEFK